MHSMPFEMRNAASTLASATKVETFGINIGEHSDKRSFDDPNGDNKIALHMFNLLV